jgi:hypothetical protein
MYILHINKKRAKYTYKQAYYNKNKNKTRIKINKSKTKSYLVKEKNKKRQSKKRNDASLMVVGEFVFPSSSLQKRKEKGSTN